jgi:hypothetical protein
MAERMAMDRFHACRLAAYELVIETHTKITPTPEKHDIVRASRAADMLP